MVKRSALVRVALGALLALGVALGLVLLVPLFALFLMFGRFLILALFVVLLAVLFLGRSSFTQAFWRMFVPDPLPVRYRGFLLPTGEWLYPDHAWSRREGDRVTVGVDALLASLLGPPDRIDLPTLGQAVTAGEPLVSLRRGYRVLEVVSPLSGTVRAINYRLASQPRTLPDSPYGASWLCRLQPAPPGSASRPHHGSPEAREWLRQEIDSLAFQLAGTLPTQTATAEAEQSWVRDLHLQIDDACWSELGQRFFGRAGPGADGPDR